jgi:serine protease Do
MTFSSSARRATSILVLTITLGACSVDSRAQQPAPAASAPAAAQVQQTPASSQQVVVSGLPNFAPLVEKFGPAVVNVDVVQSSQRQTGGPSPDDPFYEFFRRFGVPEGRGQLPPARGSGSGFIVSPDGYILTNAHVVADADEVTVTMTDRREYPAEVVGIDKATDVAVLKIEGKNLPTVKIGDPSKLKPGEWVLAIGSPFGFENSATAGIVSATARSLPSEGPTNYVPFIQTDVAVNPGNSGGPLFNLQGEVIGVNSQIFSRTGGYMGLSFAIPIDVAIDVRDQLIKTGKVTRGRIGVTIQNVNGQLADSFGLDRPRGALVSSVVKDGPSEKAGVKPGDVILEVDGRTIEVSSELPTIIARIKPGTTTTLAVWRNGKRETIKVKVDELPEPELRTASLSGKGREPDHASKLGLAVRPLQPAEKERINTEGSLVVERVTGPALAAGVRQGDIILSVNSKPVKTIEELTEAAKAAEKAGKVLALRVQRGDGGIFYLTLKLS